MSNYDNLTPDERGAIVYHKTDELSQMILNANVVEIFGGGSVSLNKPVPSELREKLEEIIKVSESGEWTL